MDVDFIELDLLTINLDGAAPAREPGTDVRSLRDWWGQLALDRAEPDLRHERHDGDGDAPDEEKGVIE